MGLLDFLKEVKDSATKDQNEEDTTAYKIGDKIEKTTQSVFEKLFGK